MSHGSPAFNLKGISQRVFAHLRCGLRRRTALLSGLLLTAGLLLVDTSTLAFNYNMAAFWVNATKLKFSTQPSATGTAGSALATQPVVEVVNSSGVVVASANNSITLALYGDSNCSTTPLTTTPNNSASLGGTITKSAVSGVATFSGVTVNLSGNPLYLQASAIGTTSACTQVMNIAGGTPAQLNLTDSTVMANQCDGVHVSLIDSFGNATSFSSPTNVTFSGGGSGVFYSDTNCQNTVVANQITFYPGESSDSLSFMDGTLESLTLEASASGVNPGIGNSISIYANLVFSTMPASITAGVCSPPITITAEDYNGNPVDLPAGGSSIQLFSDGDYNTTFYQPGDSTCSLAPVTSINMAGGASSVTFRIVDTFASTTAGIYNAYPSLNLLSSRYSPGFTVNPGAVLKIVVTGPSFVQQGTCSGPYTVTTTDTYSNINTVPANTNVTISANDSAAVYKDSGCSQAGPITIAFGASTASFYMKDSTVEEPTLTANATAYGYGTNTFLANVQSTINGIQSVAVSRNHNCVLINGGVKCWGQNNHGQLGNGTTTDSATPIQVQGLTSGVVQISVSDQNGSDDSCALLSNGTVQCWGWNHYGQITSSTSDTTCPDGSTCYLTPVQISGISGASFINADAHCALVSGNMWCWGYLPPNWTYAPTPVEIMDPTGSVPLAGITQMGVGYEGEVICAVASGNAYCWGINYSGETGNQNTSVFPTLPVQVQGLSGPVSAIAGNEYTTCALLTNGQLQCWGNGPLGDGTFNDSLAPVTANVSNVTGLAMENASICVLISGGTVQCWGDEYFGELGNGVIQPNGEQKNPTTVTGLSGVTSLWTSGTGTDVEHGCVITGGNLQCWGEGLDWDLGNDAFGNSGLPVSAQSFN